MNSNDTSLTSENSSTREMLDLERGTLAERVEASVRENPVPVIVGAVVAGIAAAAIVRLLLAPEASRSARAAAFLRDVPSQFRDYVEPYAQRARSGISRSGDVLRDAVEELPDFKSLSTHLREWWNGR